MDIDMKKLFYVIVCITMIAVVTIAVATPIKTKMESQKAKIEAVDFAP